MATIRDVARLAGVSPMTVSRVLNGTGYTSQATRARVESAIGQLGYVPNAVARQLRSKRSHTIALVLTDITNPFFTTIARGVEDEAAGRDFGVMFCNTDESDAEEVDYLQMLIQRQVDGVLLVPASNSGESLRLLRMHRVPVVVLDRRVRSPRVDQVRSDSETGAYELVRHLVELGHRRIAMLSGRRTVSTSVDRVAGYQRALAEVGVGLDSALVLYGGYNAEAGFRMAQQVLALSVPPTAMFAANNFIAFGAIRALREAGLRVPEDISIVTFDDLPDGWVMEPFMTVVAQPAYQIGRQAAALLLERLGEVLPGPPREIVLPGTLIVRHSSAAPAARPVSA